MNGGTPNVAKRLVSDNVSKTPRTPCRRVGLGRPSSGSLNKINHTKHSCLTPRVNESEKSQTPVNINKKAEHVQYNTGSYDRLKIPLTISDVLNKELVSKENLSLSRTKRLNVKRALCGTSGIPMSMDDRSDDVFILSSNNCSSSPNIKMPHSQNNRFKKQKISSDQSLNEHFLSDSSKIIDLPKLQMDRVTTSDSKSTSYKSKVTTDMIHELVSLIKEKKNKLDLMKVQQTYSKKHNLEDLRAQTSKWRMAGQEALRYSVTLARDAGLSVKIKQLIDKHGFCDKLVQYNEEDDDFF